MIDGFTDYQAKYYAHELQRSYASDHVGLLFDAQVEPKPHQIDAALFALQTPFLKGVILADEVGLGKTIEAGIVISQYWAERKRNILIVAPSSLRQQWQQELYEKFLIPSSLLDVKTKDHLLKAGSNPEVLICSYEFAQRHEASLIRAWDLVVADEAHRLRSFWNGRAKVASAVAHIVESEGKTRSYSLIRSSKSSGAQSLGAPPIAWQWRAPTTKSNAVRPRTPRSRQPLNTLPPSASVTTPSQLRGIGGCR